MWEQGMRNGYGVFYYSNGSKYEGEWVDNLKEGFAIFTHDDGRIIKGWFKCDKLVCSEQSSSIPIKNKEIDESLDQINEQSFLNAPSQLSPPSLQNGNRNDPKDPKESKVSTAKRKLTKPSTKNLEITNLTRKEELIINPYESLINIYDLYGHDEDSRGPVKDIQNLLLRHNSDLKQWYKVYVSKQHDDMEESFALTSKSFWKMLKDCGVLSPKVTIPAFNRLYLQGAKNTFEIHTNIEALTTTLEKEKCNY